MTRIIFIFWYESSFKNELRELHAVKKNYNLRTPLSYLIEKYNNAPIEVAQSIGPNSVVLTGDEGRTISRNVVTTKHMVDG
jgi:hypothetical protein